MESFKLSVNLFNMSTSGRTSSCKVSVCGRLVTVPLPESLHASVCLVRWWQPLHGGEDRDVWALDDVSLTHHMYNMIAVNFTDPDTVDKHLHTHLGMLAEHCGRPYSMRWGRQ